MTQIPQIISFEANIGSGKSTLLKNLSDYFKNNPRICILQEPVDVWNTITNTNGNTIIEEYYSNQLKYAFSFQMMAYISRLSILKDALSKNYDIILTERCVNSDKNIFAKMLYDNKIMNEIEFKIYLKWFDEFMKDIPPISYVYIRTDPNISMQRILTRNRTGENISLEYLQECHSYHEDWLMNSSEMKLVLDGNQNLIANNDLLFKVIKEIEDFMRIPSYINKKDYYTLYFDGLIKNTTVPCKLITTTLNDSAFSYAIYNNENKIFEGSDYVEKKSELQAKYLGLIHGLNKAIEVGIKNIQIESDSIYVINQINNVFACNSDILKDMLFKIGELLGKFESYHFQFNDSHNINMTKKLAEERLNMKYYIDDF